MVGAVPDRDSVASAIAVRRPLLPGCRLMAVAAIAAAAGGAGPDRAAPASAAWEQPALEPLAPAAEAQLLPLRAADALVRQPVPGGAS